MMREEHRLRVLEKTVVRRIFEDLSARATY
jgi:hypothetical protein